MRFVFNQHFLYLWFQPCEMLIFTLLLYPAPSLLQCMTRETILSPPQGNRVLVFMHPALNQTGAIQLLKNAEEKKGQNWSRFKSIVVPRDSSLPPHLTKAGARIQSDSSRRDQARLGLKGPARNGETRSHRPPRLFPTFSIQNRSSRKSPLSHRD